MAVNRFFDALRGEEDNQIFEVLWLSPCSGAEQSIGERLRQANRVTSGFTALQE
jgi:hypothetical protein